MEMKLTKISVVILGIIVFGIGFSGYLTAGVLLVACPLSGGCTEVLGYPACMYGLTIYTILLIIFLLTWAERIPFVTGRRLTLLVAVIGMLFSGSLIIQEYLNRNPLTVCAAGFSMYLLIFLLSLFLWKKEKP